MNCGDCTGGFIWQIRFQSLNPTWTPFSQFFFLGSFAMSMIVASLQQPKEDGYNTCSNDCRHPIHPIMNLLPDEDNLKRRHESPRMRLNRLNFLNINEDNFPSFFWLVLFLSCFVLLILQHVEFHMSRNLVGRGAIMDGEAAAGKPNAFLGLLNACTYTHKAQLKLEAHIISFLRC